MADQKLSQLAQLGGALLSTDDIYMQRGGTSYRVPYSTIVSSHTHVVENLTDNGNYVRMSTAERTKLAGVADNATANTDTPTGTITMYAGTSAPTGWLICDGGLYSTTTYATLFGVVSYTFGGAGSTFATPDLRGRAPIGVGTGGGLTTRALADSGGEEDHQLTEAELASHKHTMNHPQYTANDRNGDDSANVFAVNTGTSTMDSENTGGDSGHNTMQPYLALNFIIKI